MGDGERGREVWCEGQKELNDTKEIAGTSSKVS